MAVVRGYYQRFVYIEKFTISEYYDRNRSDYYKAIQSVRENDMDMTGWLEYFTHALSEQMQEIKTKGEVVIRADVLGKRHNLSERQQKAVQYVLQNGEMTIKEFEELCGDVNRRTLQRELKDLVEKAIFVTEGATHQLIYRLKV